MAQKSITQINIQNMHNIFFRELESTLLQWFWIVGFEAQMGISLKHLTGTSCIPHLHFTLKLEMFMQASPHLLSSIELYPEQSPLSKYLLIGIIYILFHTNSYPLLFLHFYLLFLCIYIYCLPLQTTLSHFYSNDWEWVVIPIISTPLLTHCFTVVYLTTISRSCRKS